MGLHFLMDIEGGHQGTVAFRTVQRIKKFNIFDTKHVYVCQG
jgi:hypothetical protein